MILVYTFSSYRHDTGSEKRTKLCTDLYNMVKDRAKEVSAMVVVWEHYFAIPFQCW